MKVLRPGITAKLSLSFVVIIILSICSLSIQGYHAFSRVLYQQTEQYISDILQQTGENIEMRLEEFTDLVFTLQSDGTVQTFLTGANSPKTSTYLNYVQEQAMNNSIYRKIIYNDKIASVAIVSESGHITVVNKSVSDISTDWVDKDTVYRAMGSPVWLHCAPEGHYITVAAQINSLVTQKPLGYVIVNIREEYIASIFSDMDFYNAGEAMIIDRNRRVVSCEDPKRIHTSMSQRYEKVVENPHNKGFYTERFEDGKEYYVAFRALPEAEWYILFTVPVDVYASVLEMLKNSLLIMAVAITAVAVSAALFLTKSLVDPVKKLARAMKCFGEGDFSVRCEVKTKDEVGILASNFNDMAYNINDLVERVYQETLLKQQAELKSLRMQINPHFLYNTLETINWVSRIKGVSEIGEMAKALGDLMRTTISGSDFIKISEEIKNIENYLQIQTFRYREKLHTTIQIDPELYQLYIPKLILQPLVENSIVHGIENKFKNGEIEITGVLREQVVIITIKDNGVGMTQSEIDKIFNTEYVPEALNHTKIGIRNVEKRIKLYYGESYGITITSKVNVGTTVVVRFPGMDAPAKITSFFEENKHSF